MSQEPLVMSSLFFRRVWRWHFWAGLVACPVLLVVALTGAAYTFRDEFEDAVRPELAFVEPAGARKPVDELVAAAKAARPGERATRAAVSSDPRRSVFVQLEPATGQPGEARGAFVDPYTAAVLGDGPARLPVFSAVLTAHRSLFAGTAGRVAVELTTSWTLVLLVSGVALWWPRRASRAWGVWLPRLRGPRYVVLRDLHTVPGLYLAPAAGLLAATGLFYTVVWLSGYNAATGGAGDFPASLRADLPLPPLPLGSGSPAPAEAALAAARGRWPGRAYTLHLPKRPGDAVVVRVRGDGGPSVAGVVAVDPSTGAVVADNRYGDLPPLGWLRVWVLPVHTGSIAGTPTKLLAFAASLGLAGLAASGVWMWIARRPAGRWGFPRVVEAPAPRAAVALILLLAALLPTVGLSLAAVLIGEWAVGRLRSAAVAIEPEPVGGER